MTSKLTLTLYTHPISFLETCVNCVQRMLALNCFTTGVMKIRHFKVPSFGTPHRTQIFCICTYIASVGALAHCLLRTVKWSSHSLLTNSSTRFYFIISPLNRQVHESYSNWPRTVSVFCRVILFNNRFNLSVFPLLPAARCSCCLDRVDPEPGGDVPERLHSLLVWFMVVLHLADEPKSTRAHTQAG